METPGGCEPTVPPAAGRDWSSAIGSSATGPAGPASGDEPLGDRWRRWYGARHPGEVTPAVTVEAHTTGGRSHRIYFLTLDGPGADPAAARLGSDRLALRLPPVGPALFPGYDLTMQARVQEAVAAAGIPAPAPVVVEEDPAWLGAPFVVSPRVAGRDPGDAPALVDWIVALPVTGQRALHERFLDVLGAIHRVPWRDQPVAAHLRRAEGDLLVELDAWDGAVEWMFDGRPPRGLVDLFDRCRRTRPVEVPPAGLLWGDVRLGNVLLDDDLMPVAVLDWEMASIGPAELDLAWYTALEEMTGHFAGVELPGFLTRDEIVAHHERRLGRPLVAFEWFEAFARARSVALHLRAERLRAEARGRIARPADDDPLLAYARERTP